MDFELKEKNKRRGPYPSPVPFLFQFGLFYYGFCCVTVGILNLVISLPPFILHSVAISNKNG